MRRAVVTGAGGFLGSALVKELVASDYDVWATDREAVAKDIAASSRIHVIPAELSTISSVSTQLPLQDYDAFYHLAWSGTRGPDRGDVRLQLCNAQWAVDALQLANAIGCKRFVCAGSIMEDEAMAAARNPGSRPGLGYVYGAAKMVAHAMCMSVAADIGIDLVWPQLTNAYGVGERGSRLVTTTIQKCLRGESPQFTSGEQNYDFVYIDDAARAFRLIGEKGRPFSQYLIGSSAAQPLREFLQEMQRTVAPQIDFVFGSVPFTGVNLPIEAFDCSATEHDTGFRATVSFAEGCRRTFQWWRELGGRPFND